MRSVERHADKAVVFERFEQVPHVCRSVRVGTAGHFVVEERCRLGEKFPVVGFRDEDVDVLVLEGGATSEQVLVPQSENARSEVIGHTQTDAQTPYPEGAEMGEHFCLQCTEIHA